MGAQQADEEAPVVPKKGRANLSYRKQVAAAGVPERRKAEAAEVARGIGSLQLDQVGGKGDGRQKDARLKNVKGEGTRASDQQQQEGRADKVACIGSQVLHFKKPDARRMQLVRGGRGEEEGLGDVVAGVLDGSETDFPVFRVKDVNRLMVEKTGGESKDGGDEEGLHGGAAMEERKELVMEKASGTRKFRRLRKVKESCF